jgi:hypothetical protein
MTRARRRLLIIGSIVLLAAFGWVMTIVVEPAF